MPHVNLTIIRIDEYKWQREKNVRLEALTKISEARFIHQKDEICLYKSEPGNTALLSYIALPSCPDRNASCIHIKGSKLQWSGALKYTRATQMFREIMPPRLQRANLLLIFMPIDFRPSVTRAKFCRAGQQYDLDSTLKKSGSASRRNSIISPLQEARHIRFRRLLL